LANELSKDIPEAKDASAKAKSVATKAKKAAPVVSKKLKAPI
jgi:hypothetical protein